MKKLFTFFALHAVLITAAFAESGKEAIPVGALYSLSGYGAEWGTDELYGTQLAIEKINAEGGINGHKLDLKIEDFRSVQADTVKGFSKLVDLDRVVIVFGPNWAEFAEIAAPIAEQNKVPLLTASGWTKTLTKDRQYIFSTLPPHPAMVKSLTAYIAGKKYNKIAIVYTDNAYLTSIANETQSQLAGLGYPVSERAAFQPGINDYRTVISKLKKDDYQALIFYLLEGGENHAFLNQLRQLKFDGDVYGSNAVLADTELKKFPDLLKNVVVFDYTLPSNQEFKNAFKKRFGHEPVAYGARAYDNVMLFKDAASRCGFAAEEIRRCLKDSHIDGISGEVRFAEDQTLSSTAVVSELLIGDGKQFKKIANP
jgi:branched-chain amino acid transport system substrate-binding protein